IFFFSSRRRHTRFSRDWSSDVCSSDLERLAFDLGTPVSCPQQAVVGGRHFKNIEGEALGSINLQTAFVQSCNTAYVQMAATLTRDQLTQAAHNFGFGAPEPLPLTSRGSSFPAPKDLVAQVSA